MLDIPLSAGLLWSSKLSGRWRFRKQYHEKTDIYTQKILPFTIWSLSPSVWTTESHVLNTHESLWMLLAEGISFSANSLLLDRGLIRGSEGWRASHMTSSVFCRLQGLQIYTYRGSKFHTLFRGALSGMDWRIRPSEFWRWWIPSCLGFISQTELRSTPLPRSQTPVFLTSLARETLDGLRQHLGN